MEKNTQEKETDRAVELFNFDTKPPDKLTNFNDYQRDMVKIIVENMLCNKHNFDASGNPELCQGALGNKGAAGNCGAIQTWSMKCKRCGASSKINCLLENQGYSALAAHYIDTALRFKNILNETDEPKQRAVTDFFSKKQRLEEDEDIIMEDLQEATALANETRINQPHYPPAQVTQDIHETTKNLLQHTPATSLEDKRLLMLQIQNDQLMEENRLLKLEISNLTTAVTRMSNEMSEMRQEIKGKRPLPEPITILQRTPAPAQPPVLKHTNSPQPTETPKRVRFSGNENASNSNANVNHHQQDPRHELKETMKQLPLEQRLNVLIELVMNGYPSNNMQQAQPKSQQAPTDDLDQFPELQRSDPDSYAGRAARAPKNPAQQPKLPKGYARRLGNCLTPKPAPAEFTKLVVIVQDSRVFKACNDSREIQSAIRHLLKKLDIHNQVVEFSKIGNSRLELYVPTTVVEYVKNRLNDLNVKFDNNLDINVPPAYGRATNFKQMTINRLSFLYRKAKFIKLRECILSHANAEIKQGVLAQVHEQDCKAAAASLTAKQEQERLLKEAADAEKAAADITAPGDSAEVAVPKQVAVSQVSNGVVTTAEDQHDDSMDVVIESTELDQSSKVGAHPTLC